MKRLGSRPPSRPTLAGATWIALLAVAIGCNSGSSPSSLRRAIGDGECIIGCDDVFSIRYPNALTTADFFNALTANGTTLGALNLARLNSADFAAGGVPELRQPLHDERARHYMRYLVGCALSADQSVVWDDPYPGGLSYRWDGEAGLCPEWNSGPPSGRCLRKVSSCILARNNLFGLPVMLSMRGANEGPFPTGDPPVTGTEYVERSSASYVMSFAPCSAPTAGSLRDCGWSPDFAGTCTPGTRVRLGAGGIPADPTCGGCGGCPRLGTLTAPRLVMRVCDGLDGCNVGSPSPRVISLDEGTCDGAPFFAPATWFDCPSSGFFSVMVAPFFSDGPGSGVVASNLATGFPVSQLVAYAVREGAYYGNLFDTSPDRGLDPAVNVRIDPDTGRVLGHDEALLVPTAFHSAWTCFDSDWTVGEAYAFHRVCAVPNFSDPTMSTGCAAHVAGCCGDYPIGPTFKCEFDRRGDLPNYDDFEHCSDRDASRMWHEPLTVFLHGACDVPGQRQVCERRH